ncbi:tRNA uridine-5-carboxymethylaminomethyl(34) synthesis GTPase MnmE [Flammeovirga yaeyamensis]|uniref:tRNA modification GTPase MnmE n=1 Tax=Flammeovirga yaeyamensis TaxID=367791 RepID=A0AAX1N867_9BACT|nr:tRNA uridine-5-carboxymethylaminomethyl(34) synthesis GTPase MnmE [Flammeovirga yaeyamensis]MBB3701323.1 tRNA modification GTPase [Flammeovirga yaeyamensis]NMF38208.1 tRNA uridine-5-carboxymethylaminomethyl(34) synthesis GTPase MnmE [Flammeovirga yaeyamensis]QWG02621.1 tRNA uridine-5-carboxymethylaminomethyl(34) synthesis GTPase MnmE [Flammeovirga yaeyamensis]
MHTTIELDTIVALATVPGQSAIHVIRLSGPDAIKIVNKVFKGKDLEKQAGHTAHFGTIREEDGTIVDEVLATIFYGPKSYTGENTVEVSCHGSQFIADQLLQLFMKVGARYAKAGEFTQRAFANGKLDLAQAEAVADLIAADSHASRDAAMQQMRGGFSRDIKKLREKLIHFASMIELELDFSEEDVEFASRDDLKDLINELQRVIRALIDSFSMGNVLKNGVPTVIAGKPNAGKSTLLNALLNEEKAIVSEVAGTTRDFIEDEINIGGVTFRFVDTAGLRETQDRVEAIGVQRSYEKMKKASLIMYMFDAASSTIEDVKAEVEALEALGVPYILVANKIDQLSNELSKEFDIFNEHLLKISADKEIGIEELKERALHLVNLDKVQAGNTMVTNARHYQSLRETMKALDDVINGIDLGMTGDFLALDIRNSLHHLGEITGEVTTDDLLENIFSKFCIGK